MTVYKLYIQISQDKEIEIQETEMVTSRLDQALNHELPEIHEDPWRERAGGSKGRRPFGAEPQTLINHE